MLHVPRRVSWGRGGEEDPTAQPSEEGDPVLGRKALVCVGKGNTQEASETLQMD
jgi:hypothetical protein